MRIETTARLHCVHCGRVTAHEVITYYQDSVHSEEISWCTVCGE